MSVESLVKYIENRCKEMKISLRKASLQAVGSPDFIRQMRGAKNAPKTDKLLALARVLEIPPNVLLQHVQGSKEGWGNVAFLSGEHFRRVEVIGAVQAGVFTEALEWDYDRRYLVMFPKNDGYDPTLPRYGLEIKGESMNRVFPAGSVVCVINFYDLNRPPETGDYVVIQRRATCVPGAEATVKALQIMDDGSWRLWPQSTEPEFQQPLIIPPNNSDSQDTAEAPDIEVKGLVVGLLKTKLKASF